MIDVYRYSDGDLSDTTGPKLRVEFSEDVVKAVFSGEQLTYRYMGLKRRSLPGFAPEDKFHIVPVTAEQIALRRRRNIDIWADPGGDIFLELGQEAGVGHDYEDKVPEFAIDEISDDPSPFLDRGIDTLVLPSLCVIERERTARLSLGLSYVDPNWKSAH